MIHHHYAKPGMGRPCDKDCWIKDLPQCQCDRGGECPPDGCTPEDCKPGFRLPCERCGGYMQPVESKCVPGHWAEPQFPEFSPVFVAAKLFIACPECDPDEFEVVDASNSGLPEAHPFLGSEP